jgi:hypothetical protein
MKTFRDAHGAEWVATALEEDTPRHHGRWYMAFRPADGGPAIPHGEVRWKSRASAERTIRTMADAELRRRLASLLGRARAG